MGEDVIPRLLALLDALAREPKPPTTVREPAEALDQHILDSLTGLGVSALGTAGRIGDLGSGAGFPGLVIAAALPAASVDLIESNKRKCAVIERIAAQAGISNTRAVAERAEEWAAGAGAERYECVLARAVAPLAVLVEYAAPLLEAGGSLIAWKGLPSEDEDRGGDEAAAVVGMRLSERLEVTPYEGSRQRTLYVYCKDRPTPDRFPRRAGMARKRPLA